MTVRWQTSGMVLVGRERQLDVLADAAAQSASGRGRLVLVSGEAGVGKSALVAALRPRMPAVRWLTGHCEAQFTPRPLGPLLDVAAGLAGGLPGLLRGAAPAADVFAAVTAALSVPTVLVVEDAHWADEATLDLVRFLARRVHALPATVIITHRTDVAEADQGWRQTLAELSRERVTVRVDLEPLDLPAVTELAHGSSLDPAVLLRLTGGNPFFLTELLAHGSSELPRSARDAVLGRVLTLPAELRTALEVLTVMGGPIVPQAALAAQVHAEHLDALLGSGLLVADEDRLRFRHELARLAIDSTIGPHRRPALHERVFEALVATGDDDVARLAYHADEAGRAADAAEHAVAAGIRAAALGAHREAAVQFRRGLRNLTASELRSRAQLHDALADELAFLDQWADSAAERARAIELWRGLGEPVRVGDDLRRLSIVAWRQCRGAESNRYAQQSVELLQPLGPSVELGWAYLNRSAGNTDLDQLAADAASAQRVADSIALPALTHHLALAEAEHAFRTGGDWEGPLRQALWNAGALGLDHLGGAAYSTLYEFYVSSFRFHDGEVDFRQGLAFCDDRELTTYGSCLRGRRALALAETGRWQGSLAIAAEVLDSTASEVNQLTSRVATALVRMRTGQGDPDEVLQPALAWAESLAETPWVVLTRLAQVERYWLLDDQPAAARELALAEAALTPTFPYEAAEVARWRRRFTGDGAAAETSAVWERRGCGYRAALALIDQGDAEALGEALARLEAMGAHGAAEVARRRLRRLGRPAAPSGRRSSTRRHPQGLTERQHEILQLISDGLTNNEIAARLTISPKTVDHHVSAVLAKLGVATRREAARLPTVSGASGTSSQLG